MFIIKSHRKSHRSGRKTSGRKSNTRTGGRERYPEDSREKETEYPIPCGEELVDRALAEHESEIYNKYPELRFNTIPNYTINSRGIPYRVSNQQYSGNVTIDTSPSRNPNMPPTRPGPQSPFPPGNNRLIVREVQLFSVRIPEFRTRKCTGSFDYPCGVKCSVSWRGSRCSTRYCTKRWSYDCAIQRRNSQFTLYLVITLPNPNSLEDRVREQFYRCYDRALEAAEIAAVGVIAAASSTIAGIIAAIPAAIETGLKTFYDTFVNCVRRIGSAVLEGLLNDFNITTRHTTVPRSDWRDIVSIPKPNIRL
ncbi:hypothetical protein ABE225_28910 [Priestia megaterium]